MEIRATFAGELDSAFAAMLPQNALPIPAARVILRDMLAGATKRIRTATKPSITTTTTSTTSTKSASGDGRNS